MNPADRWRRVEELFYAALELEGEARDKFLHTACGSDTELLHEVQSLLESSEKPIHFLPDAVVAVAREISRESDQTAITGQLTAAPAGLAAGSQVTHYQVLSVLGAGGMGEVYLAEDTQLRRRVALKVLAPGLTSNASGLRRFEQEAHAASALNHPNILTIYEFGHADGLHFIASEYVDGVTLRQELTRGPVPLHAAVDIALQLAGALAAAHATGIVHRDIKPENIIVRTDGIVKILDFGIAKLSAAQRVHSSHRGAAAVALSTSAPGMVWGTPRYMSPEQARGLGVDARSDIFSLGSVFYELVTGQAAFDGDTTSDVIAEILKVEPKAPSELTADVPPEIERIITKSLCKNRDNRYQSARDLLNDLQAFKKNLEFRAHLKQSSDGQVETPDSPQPGLARQPWFWGAVVLLIVLCSGGYFGLKKFHAPVSSKGPRSLAVLPFRNLNGDPKTDFLGFSLADEVITKLDYVNALTVRPSSSVDKYRDQIVDPKKVAAELNVDTLLMGTFIKDGDDFRITAQLVDVKPDKILWRDSIDVKYDKLLTVQDQVSRQIIKGLELNLSPTEVANLKPEKPINPAAYEDYLRGIDLYSLGDFTAAVDMLSKATALEPNYAPAWAQLGRAYTTNASLQSGGREAYGNAQAAFEKAMALNPALVEPRVYLGNLLTDTGRVEEAVPLLRSVLQDSPNNAEAHWELGYAYRFAGMLKESIEECEKARENNPAVKISSSAMNGDLYMGEYGEVSPDTPCQSFPVHRLLPWSWRVLPESARPGSQGLRRRL